MSLQRRFNAQSDLQFANYDKELGYCHPTVDFDAVYNLIHVFHHLLEEGIGLRHIIDYYYIINALKDENDKIIVIEAIKSIGLYRFLQAMMWVLKKSCNATDEMLLCEPDEKEGQFLLREILNSGNFGYYQKEKGMRRNSVKRYWTMAKHYPSEVLWMVPWKVWHKLWRIANQY